MTIAQHDNRTLSDPKMQVLLTQVPIGLVPEGTHIFELPFPTKEGGKASRAMNRFVIDIQPQEDNSASCREWERNEYHGQLL